MRLHSMLGVMPPIMHEHTSVSLGWWRSVAVMRCVRSTKLFYAGPG